MVEGRFFMNKLRIIYFVFLILAGGIFFVYAGIDDSPGGQLIGLILVVVGIIGMVRKKKVFIK